MDYKYIEQLMERYWRCETSLQEEEILRSFFAQDDVPASLMAYKSLFCFVQEDKGANMLDDKFDEKVLSMIDDEQPVKAKVITMRQRLAPLFKAAAIVAIVLTLGNAMSGAFSAKDDPAATTNVANINKTSEGPSVAKADSLRGDSLQHSIASAPSMITK